MWKKISVYMILLFLLPIAGCWDNRDVTEINIVTAVGLEKTPEGKIELSVEIPNPRSIITAPGGDREKFAIYTSTGDTVFEAVRNSLKKADKTLIFTQLELIIIAEDLAREGVMEVLDFFERDSEPSLKAIVLIAKGNKVKEIMELESDLEDIPTLHLINTIEANHRTLGSISKIRLIDLLIKLCGQGFEAVLPVIYFDSESEETDLRKTELEGLALLKKDCLVGFFDAKQSRCWSVLKKKNESTIYNVPSPFNPDQLIAFEMERAQTKKEVEFIDGQAMLRIHTEMNGDIGDLGKARESEDFGQEEMIQQLEIEISKFIKEEIKNTVAEAQRLKTDVFGFGDVYHKKNPAEWKKVKDMWDVYFSEGSLEVNIKVKVENSGYVVPRLRAASKD